MPNSLKILGIHGLGDHRDGRWKTAWSVALKNAIPVEDQADLDISFFEYDHLFERVNISFFESMSALAKLAGSGAWHGLFGEAREGRFGAARPRGLLDSARDKLRWTAGYVVAWVEDEGFRKDVRAELLDRIGDERPDVVLGHSLGSLIAYDALASQDAFEQRDVRNQIQELVYVSLGSQIGNPFVRANLLPGRIIPLATRMWYHLYNPEDDVFTAPIKLPGVRNFQQVRTSFDIPGWADHDADDYFNHSATRLNVWSPIVAEFQLDPSETLEGAREFSHTLLAKRGFKDTEYIPKKRALLVGINEYPDPAARLDGCINDVYLMSSLLQEQGFEARDIRIVLDYRATANGIRERLEWLLDAGQPEDELLFYFSGHGTRIPAYNAEEEADHFDEALVPYDFDWSPERAVLDDQIFDLYSQLHYDTKLSMIFDCCHSGGMHRHGGPKARGLTPPDDIRHRALCWDGEGRVWRSREFGPINEKFARKSDAEVQHRYSGEQGNVMRLGRAMMLRQQSYRDYDKRESPTGSRYFTPAENENTFAPYLPVILQACQEHELAYEYRHGAESYGAFTYSLAQEIRRRDGNETGLQELVEKVAGQLARLSFFQTPAWLAPGDGDWHLLH